MEVFGYGSSVVVDVVVHVWTRYIHTYSCAGKAAWGQIEVSVHTKHHIYHTYGYECSPKPNRKHGRQADEATYWHLLTITDNQPTLAVNPSEPCDFVLLAR